jgi:acetyl-CoA acyltransferase 1
MPMGWTSESITSDHNISRGDMDAFAAASFQRAEAAVDAGRFADEMIPFSIRQKSAHGPDQTLTVSHDEGLRRGTTPQALEKLRPAFPQWSPGYTTGGNASQVTDGVAAVMLMRRDKAEALGLEILGKWVTTRIAGMGHENIHRHLLTLSNQAVHLV